jgi:hypothetical protein
MKFTLHGKIGSFSGSYEKNKKEAEQGAALQAVLELRLMTPEDCGLEIKKIDENSETFSWKNVISNWKNETEIDSEIKS